MAERLGFILRPVAWRRFGDSYKEMG